MQGRWSTPDIVYTRTDQLDKFQSFCEVHLWCTGAKMPPLWKRRTKQEWCRKRCDSFFVKFLPLLHRTNTSYCSLRLMWWFRDQTCILLIVCCFKYCPLSIVLFYRTAPQAKVSFLHSCYVVPFAYHHRRECGKICGKFEWMNEDFLRDWWLMKDEKWVWMMRLPASRHCGILILINTVGFWTIFYLCYRTQCLPILLLVHWSIWSIPASL